MKKIALLLFLFLLLSSAFSQTTLGLELEQAIQQRPYTAFPIFVKLKKQANIQKISQRVSQSRLDRQERRRQIFASIQEENKRVQDSVVDFIQKAQARKSGRQEAAKMTRVNLVNGISLRAEGDLIKELSAHPEVGKVLLDVPRVMVSPTNRNDQDQNLWGLDYIKSKQVNQQGITGEGVVVAVVDTGVDLDHPAFAPGQILVDKAVSFVEDEADADDRHGHGTHCAGTVAGQSYGVAPGAKIIPIKGLNRFGSGTYTSLVKGIEYAAQHADVISMSFAGSESTDGTPFDEAVEEAIKGGCICIVAGGNNGPDSQTIGSPGVVNEAITVGAIDQYGKLADFSSRGPTARQIAKPDIVAPGVKITSAWKDGGVMTIDGTSMATPHVAGVVALLLSIRPGLTQSQVKEILLSNTFGESQIQSYGKGCVNALAVIGVGKNYARLSSKDEPVKTDEPGEKNNTLSITSRTQDAPVEIASRRDMGRYRALVIANYKYRGDWNPLSTPKHNAQSLIKTLVRRYGFSDRDIVVVKNGDARQIRSGFAKLGRSARRDDNILIAYFGRGYEDRDYGGTYWVPSDVRGEDVSDMIAMDDVFKWTSRLARDVRHVVLISEANLHNRQLSRHGGASLQSRRTPQWVKGLNKKKSCQILFVYKKDGEFRETYRGSRLSPLGYFLTRILHKNNENYLTTTEVALKLQKALRKARQTLRYGILKSHNEGGEFFFVQSGTSVSTVQNDEEENETGFGDDDGEKKDHHRDRPERRRRGRSWEDGEGSDFDADGRDDSFDDDFRKRKKRRNRKKNRDDDGFRDEEDDRDSTFDDEDEEGEEEDDGFDDDF